MKQAGITLPLTGLTSDELLRSMQEIKSGDSDWNTGKMFGYVFYPGKEEARVIEAAYSMFSSENALNPSLFSSLKRFENESVRMVAELLHAPAGSAGSLTSGGTESILMALKSARNKSRIEHPEIIMPEVVMPVSAHPAFDKAAHYLNVKVVHVELRADKRVDTDAMVRAVNPNTILIVCSSPSYPHGVIDPVSEIGQLALERNIPFHVDACMGGLMLPFVEKLGYSVPLFDFRVPGVTSISADLHKYGYSPKGASVIIYSTRQMRKYQFFVHTDWPGGLYASPTMLGTKCGGPIAAAWATMMHLGVCGYMQKAEKVMKCVKKIQEGINSVQGLYVVSDPDMSILSFTSDVIDIFEVGDELSAKGWHLDRIQFPNCLHMTVSYHNTDRCDEFISDLREAVYAVSHKKIRSFSSHLIVSFVKGMSRLLPEELFRRLSSSAAGVMSGKSNKPSMGAAMYGITASLENRGNVHDMVLDVLDGMY